MPEPHIVATIGLHGSASTWVFNVVRELMEAAHGADAVHSQYADRPEKLEETGKRCLVIKSHHGSAEMDAWLAARQVPLFLSIRDPRDAAISMATRFKASLQDTAQWVYQDCRRMARLAAGQEALLLRYETRFFDKPETVAAIARRLGVQVPAETQDGIFSRYRTEAVSAFARSLDQLPPERLTMVTAFAMDKVTQILAPHIGDARSGKWRELPPPLPERLTAAFLPFLRQFDYPLE